MNVNNNDFVMGGDIFNLKVDKKLFNISFGFKPLLPCCISHQRSEFHWLDWLLWFKCYLIWRADIIILYNNKCSTLRPGGVLLGWREDCIGKRGLLQVLIQLVLVGRLRKPDSDGPSFKEEDRGVGHICIPWLQASAFGRQLLCGCDSPWHWP